MTAIAVRNLTKPGRYAVGQVPGLLLQVSNTGAKSWVLRVTVGSLRRDIGLGSLAEVPLAVARDKAREYRETIRRGVDPVQQKKALRAAMIALQARQLTFKDAAIRAHRVKQAEFGNDKHARDWMSSLERHAFPIIGQMHVQDIELVHVLKVLEPIWMTSTETATRVRQRIEFTLTWATVNGYREGENVARWKGNLEVSLPKPQSLIGDNHFAALPYSEVPAFMVRLRQDENVAARAAEFAILTAARSGEARGATWSEIDYKARLWTLPAARTKTKDRDHQVPLAECTIEMLQQLPRIAGNDHLFVPPRAEAYSDMALLKRVKVINPEITLHGFRSCFRDWGAETTSHQSEVLEMALGHKIASAVERSYRRGPLLEKRRALMNEWADFVGTGK